MTTTYRRTGWYWIRLRPRPGKHTFTEPQPAYWTNTLGEGWYLCGRVDGPNNDDVEVLSERLSPPIAS